MKKIVAFLLVLVVLMNMSFAAAENEVQLEGNPKALFEAVKWCNDFPKNAQVQKAMEYLCKMEGIQVRALIAELSQDAHMEEHFGTCSRILIVDLETMNTITFKNVVWPEGEGIASKADALNMLFSHYDSYLQNGNPQIYADHELIFELTPMELSAVNGELSRYFQKPSNP